jgi:hypothetical protein
LDEAGEGVRDIAIPLVGCRDLLCPGGERMLSVPALVKPPDRGGLRRLSKEISSVSSVRHCIGSNSPKRGLADGLCQRAIDDHIYVPKRCPILVRDS